MCEYQDLNVEEPSLENEEGEDEEVLYQLTGCTRFLESQVLG